MSARPCQPEPSRASAPLPAPTSPAPPTGPSRATSADREGRLRAPGSHDVDVAPPGPDQLDHLAEVLARAGQQGHLARVGVTPLPHGEVDLHVHVPTGELVEALAGWRPPRSWWAVGLLAPVAEVRATRPPSGRGADHRHHVRGDLPLRGDQPPGGGAPRQRGAPERDGARQPAGPATSAGVALLVARDGSTALALVDERGRWSPEVLGEPSSGPLEELCRRALGLATPSCPTSPRRLWAAAWLDAITAVAADRPAAASPLRWPALAALHPLRAALPTVEPHAPDRLARLADHPAARASWAALRRAAAEAQVTFPDTSRRLASWFDDGSFGRWLLSRYPQPEQLLDALADLLGASEYAALAETVAAWDVRIGTGEAAAQGGSAP